MSSREPIEVLDSQDPTDVCPVHALLPHASSSVITLIASHSGSTTQDSIELMLAPSVMQSANLCPLAHANTGTCHGCKAALPQAAAASNLHRADRLLEPASPPQVQDLMSSDADDSLPLFRPRSPSRASRYAAGGSSANYPMSGAHAPLCAIAQDVKTSSNLQVRNKLFATKPPWPARYPSSAAATASPHCSQSSFTRSNRFDEGIEAQFEKNRVLTENLLPFQASTAPQKPKCRTRMGYVDTLNINILVAMVMFASSVAGAAVAQQVAAPYSLGTWTTAVLSVARSSLAATSLPNLGVAIFAGGYGTCCRVVLSGCEMRCFVKGYA